jgi:hypothetical protein
LAGLVAGGLASPFSRAQAADSLEPATWDHGYAGWDALLRRVVDGAGLVDYRAVSEDAGLQTFLDAVAALPPEILGRWSRAQQIAFWVNVYNALTFQLVVQAGVPGSLRALEPDPWEDARWRVAGRTVSLNFVEHQKLRRTLREPRVHFVLVCAAKGCPRLPAYAIQAAQLDAQLDRAMVSFLQDPARVRVDPQAARVALSSILRWYGDDFVGWVGTPSEPAFPGRPDGEAAVLRLVSRHGGEAARAFLSGGRFQLTWIEYDWSLNSR